MFGRIKRTLRNGKVRTGFLVLMAALFLGGYFFKPAFGANGLFGGGSVLAQAEHSAGESIKLFAPLRDYVWGERLALIVVLVIAIAGLALRADAGQAGQGGRPGHAEDAGDRRRPSARGPTPTWAPSSARSAR